MKIPNLLVILTPLIAVVGCTTSEHTGSAAYTTPPGYGNQVISAPGTYSSGTTPRVVTQAPVPSVSDGELLSRVHDTLRNGSLATTAEYVQVSVLNGQVTLAGQVPSDQQRQLVDDAVRNVSGVVSVNDQLRVTPAGTAAYPSAPGYERSTGSVAPAPTGRTEAGNRTYSAPAPVSPGTSISPGSIFNLQVQDLTEADRTLAQRILENLRTDSALGSLLPRVNIQVTEGKVILSGVVQSEAQRRTIASEVQRAAGVNNVSDELQIINGSGSNGQSP